MGNAFVVVFVFFFYFTDLVVQFLSLVFVSSRQFEEGHSQDLISNAPHYLPYNSYRVGSENLILDQLRVP